MKWLSNKFLHVYRPVTGIASPANRHKMITWVSAPALAVFVDFFLRNEKVLHHCVSNKNLTGIWERKKMRQKQHQKSKICTIQIKKKYQNCSLDEIPAQRKYVSPPFRRWACGCNLQENAARSTTWIISWIPPNHYVKGNSRDPQKWDPLPEKCLIM